MPGACNKFDADGIALLANAIRLNSELTSLDVKSSGIGDVGTALLSEALEFNDALTTLNLEQKREVLEAPVLCHLFPCLPDPGQAFGGGA